MQEPSLDQPRFLELTPIAQKQASPYNPSSWNVYHRYADEQLFNESAALRSQEPEVLTQNIDTIAALTAAGKHDKAIQLSRMLIQIHANHLPLAEEEMLQLQYWQAYNTLVYGQHDNARVALATVDQNFQRYRDSAATTSRLYELTGDLANLKALRALYGADYSTAQSLQEDALDNLRKKLPPDCPQLLVLQSQLAQTLRLQKQLAPARALSLELADQLDQTAHFGKNHPLTLQNRFYAETDQLACGGGSRQLMARLGRLMIAQRKQYPEHPSTFLLLRDYAIAEAYYGYKFVNVLPSSLFLERAHTHVELAQKELKELLSPTHPETEMTDQVSALLLGQKEKLIRQLASQDHQGWSRAHYEFAMANLSIGDNLPAFIGDLFSRRLYL